MTRRQFAIGTVLSLALVGGSFGVATPAARERLPTRLSDAEFWRVASTFSEPEGTFHSENLVSNEARFQTIVPEVIQKVVPGRAYVGVGSEQNFTYIAAARPAVAFIVDVRRGNLDLHLLYKALFELSTDRADFVSRLFSRPRPSGLTTTSTPGAIFSAYAATASSQELFDQNLRAVLRHLTTTHGFALSAGDREGIEYVYRAWFADGPNLHYTLNTGGGRGGGGGQFPTYADLMTATDGSGVNRSYLSTEDSFRLIKDLETRNLIVPVVGNFGGPKALRAVAGYLKQHETVVSAFYVSNVEQYLQQDGIWGNFCASAATFPVDQSSVFIRSARGGFGGRARGFDGTLGGGFALRLVPIAAEVATCATR